MPTFATGAEDSAADVADADRATEVAGGVAVAVATEVGVGGGGAVAVGDDAYELELSPIVDNG